MFMMAYLQWKRMETSHDSKMALQIHFKNKYKKKYYDEKNISVKLGEC